jgi:hypothetical protein
VIPISDEGKEVLRYLFHGYYDMLCYELVGVAPQNIDPFSKPLLQFIAMGYAILNASLWESGKEKLEKGGGSHVGKV